MSHLVECVPNFSEGRRLEVVYDMLYHAFDFDQFTHGPNQALTGDEQEQDWASGATILPPLLASPYLSNLRVFKLGFSDSGDWFRHSTMVAPLSKRISAAAMSSTVKFL